LDHLKDYLCDLKDKRGSVVFSNMTDWNPAEMISTTPNPLALSLYEYLITDSTWRLSRQKCGYHHPPSERLMVNFLGKPYINVRSSFKSFVPETIPYELREQLVEVWLEKLLKHPEMHDKIEFEIVPTCYSFLIDRQVQDLLAAGMDEQNVEFFVNELRQLTDLHISQKIFSIDAELEKAQRLAARVDEGEFSTVDVATINFLLEECIAEGILPFANLARMAFIGTAILRSLVSLKILSEQDEYSFQTTLQTVTASIISDHQRMRDGRISIDEFLKHYGHLRPGTYDIMSKRYDESPQMYLNDHEVNERKPTQDSIFNYEKLEEIDRLMAQHGLKANGRQLVSFIKHSICGREEAKFAFTKAVSLVLQMVQKLGSLHGIPREDVAFLDVRSLLRWDTTVAVDNLANTLRGEIDSNKRNYQYAQACKLPDVILDASDIFYYHQIHSKPNFVTKQRVIAEAVCLDDYKSQVIRGKIVMIERSDPGFDWIFTNNIAGVVTMYGGANSHMAIRCAEFNIPAAIGCGVAIYSSLTKEKMVEIDCIGEIVRACVAH